MSSAPGITQQRCWNHPSRVAVARCPECGRFFCRECVTEHRGQLICADCLKKLTREENDTPAEPRRATRATWRVSLGLVGLLLLWIAFYSFGQILTNLPTDFHEGRFWDAEVTP